jgi:hypothetical protein
MGEVEHASLILRSSDSLSARALLLVELGEIIFEVFSQVHSFS